MGSYRSPLAGLLALLALASTSQASEDPRACHADNCARAVTGTHRGPDAVSTAQADCSRFMKTTVTASSAVTITSTITTVIGATSTGTSTTRTDDRVTGGPVQTAGPVLPDYALPCKELSRYSSACSCWGITAETKTFTPTTTITTTVSLAPGPTYTPPVPTSGNYTKCVFDPSGLDPFDLLDPNSALPIIKNGSLAKVVQEVSDPWIPVRYKTVTATGAPDGVYDLQLVSESGPTYLWAIYEDGTVGFVTTSSNGQSYVVEGATGKKYVTSVFSFTCEGRLTAGILGGSEFHFIITDDQRVTASIFPLSAGNNNNKRDIPVPEGFYVIPPIGNAIPAGERCHSGQTAVSNGIAPSANGCGAKDGIKVPDLTFGQCCNDHDICFGTCSEGFNKCNLDFYSCMLSSCAPLMGIPVVGLACTGAASTYYLAVQFKGQEPFAQATKDHCECKCDDPALTACDDRCVDTKNDPLNCGDCNFVCPTGSCTNGACSFQSCTGSSCGAFGPCGPGGNCVCASITNGQGFCVNGETPCSGLAGCGTSADCPLGSVCAVNTCCGRNVCITTDQCGGFNSKIKRAWMNATIASPGNWIGGSM